MTSDLFWALVFACFLIAVLYEMVKAPETFKDIDELYRRIDELAQKLDAAKRKE